MKRKWPKSTGKKKPKTEYQKAKKKTWEIFSLYIRMRDCLKTTGTIERGICCTCGALKGIKEGMQAGHFIDGRHNAILFHEDAVHMQCAGCNMFKGGNKIEYFLFMEKEYGRDFIDELKRESNKIVKLTTFDLEEIHDKYKKRIDYMKEHKQLCPGDIDV